jgi:hypothetical protein
VSYTPGPWTAAQIADENVWGRPKDDPEHYGFVRPVLNNACIRMDDARLIAAAPRMLNVLRGILACPECRPAHIAKGGHLDEALSAVAEATGEQP